MLKRPLWMAGGLLSLALAWIGVALPLLPTVPFLLLALFCFARGNPAWEQRLLNHPRYGASLRDWKERGAISRKGKTAALIAMTVAGVIAWLLTGFPVALVPIAIMAVVGTWLWTRPE
jgi:uncharacterized membrane protein YbaN (DUF454 family)